MQFQYTFRHVDSSQALKEYTEEQMNRVGRHLLKESRWQVNYSMGRHDCRVEVTVSGGWGRFKASASGDDFYAAVDLAAEKIGKQFQKRKEQLQYHKKPELSRGGRLERVNESLEYNDDPYFHSNHSKRSA